MQTILIQTITLTPTTTHLPLIMVSRSQIVVVLRQNVRAARLGVRVADVVGEIVTLRVKAEIFTLPVVSVWLAAVAVVTICLVAVVGVVTLVQVVPLLLSINSLEKL